MTEPETQFANKLEQLGFLVKAYCDRDSSDPSNTALSQFRLDRYVFDFALPSLRILFEIDGEHWHPSRFRLTSKQASRGISDKEKSDCAKAQGWMVMHISGSKVEKCKENLCSLIFKRLEANGI